LGCVYPTRDVELKNEPNGLPSVLFGKGSLGTGILIAVAPFNPPSNTGDKARAHKHMRKATPKTLKPNTIPPRTPKYNINP